MDEDGMGGFCMLNLRKSPLFIMNYIYYLAMNWNEMYF